MAILHRTDMGNQHEIRQIAPSERLGAAIPIRDGCEAMVSRMLAQHATGHFYTSLAFAGEDYTIRNMDYHETMLGCLQAPHFVIQSGGKMWCGYERFRRHIANVSACLADAIFLVGDEQEFIDEFQIADQKLNYRRVHAGYWIPLDDFIRQKRLAL